MELFASQELEINDQKVDKTEFENSQQELKNIMKGSSNYIDQI